MKNNLPLEGITVLELGNSVAAPFAGEILGDLGADVIKVELRDPGENARLKEFILERVDVVLQNMRPGLVEELGLDGPTLRRSKPELIYANIGAFGARGPYKDRPGYDPLMQAFGGLMSVTGEEGRPPVRVGTAIVDMGTGMWSVIGIISALLARTRSGEGCIVGTS